MMHRCKRCSAPVADGVEYCPPREWIESTYNGPKVVKFRGCDTMHVPIRVSRSGPQAGKWSRRFVAGAASTPVKPNSVQLAGQIPIWMQLDDMGFYSNLRCYKHAAGSEWTNEHYGFGWSRFSRELRKAAKELHIVLVGYHVPTLAAADVVEGVLLGSRSRRALSG